MSENNRAIVEKVNAAFSAGQTEEFLSYCTDDVIWTMVGDTTKQGKDNILEWMSSMSGEAPPKFTVKNLFGEGDSAVCHGDMTMKEQDGSEGNYSYCDVYEFSGDKIAKMTSFVIKRKSEGESSSSAAA